MMEVSGSAECFVTDSVTCGQQTRSGMKRRNDLVQCVTVWQAASVGLSYSAILVAFSSIDSHQLLHSEYCNTPLC